MRRGAAADSTSGTTPTDSTARPLPGQRPAGRPGLAPTTVQPADSTGNKPAVPNNSPINSPANTPSPGTTTPGGITPAGSPGGRP